MPKVLWRTFNSASVFQTAGSESPPPLPTKRDGPIRLVHCASLNKKKQQKQQNTFVCKALNSKIHVAAQEACRSCFFNVTAAPPCGYTNEKPSRSSALWCKITGLLTHVQTIQKLCFCFIFFFVSLIKYRLSAVSTVSSRCAAPSERPPSPSLTRCPKETEKVKACSVRSLLYKLLYYCEYTSEKYFCRQNGKKKDKKSWHAVKIMNRSIFLLDKLSIIYQWAFFFSISSIFFLKVSQLSFLPLFWKW